MTQNGNKLPSGNKEHRKRLITKNLDPRWKKWKLTHSSQDFRIAFHRSQGLAVSVSLWSQCLHGEWRHWNTLFQWQTYLHRGFSEPTEQAQQAGSWRSTSHPTKHYSQQSYLKTPKSNSWINRPAAGTNEMIGHQQQIHMGCDGCCLYPQRRCFHVSKCWERGQMGYLSHTTGTALFIQSSQPDIPWIRPHFEADLRFANYYPDWVKLKAKRLPCDLRSKGGYDAKASNDEAIRRLNGFLTWQKL